MICILTYDIPQQLHRKTQDLLLRLKAMGYFDLHVIATPWKPRRAFLPLIPHRPVTTVGITISELCRNLGYKVSCVSEGELAQVLSTTHPDATLIAGAGILPKEVVESCTIINAHPGYLPYVRGLDALKWAIYEGHPIGVTTYIASVEVDTGLLISQRRIPIYHWDTFHSVAYRQYEMEIAMLAESIEDIRNAPPLTRLGNQHPVHRRMPHSLEMRLLQRFQKIVDLAPIDIN